LSEDCDGYSVSLDRNQSLGRTVHEIDLKASRPVLFLVDRNAPARMIDHVAFCLTSETRYFSGNRIAKQDGPGDKHHCAADKAASDHRIFPAAQSANARPTLAAWTSSDSSSVRQLDKRKIPMPIFGPLTPITRGRVRRPRRAGRGTAESSSA